MSGNNFKIGDMVYCYHVPGERTNGTILDINKDGTYSVRVYLPKTKDERKETYVEYLTLKLHEIGEIKR